MSSSLTSTSVWDVLSRLGPEDGLVAVAQPNSSPLVTAGADWAVTRGPLDESKLYYKNGAETERFIAMASTPSVENRILRDLQKSRYLCAQPSFALELCKRTHRAHQQKQCTPTYVEVLKCTVKIARAVDLTCRQQFTSLSTCLRGADGATASCMPQLQAFDTCTENW